MAFLAHFGPRTGPQKFSKSPRPPQTSKPRIAAAGGRTIRSRGRTKVTHRSPSSEEPKISRKLPGGTELRPKNLPPGQNVTDGVNRLGPKGSQLGDPKPNQDLALGPSWRGVCFSLFGKTPFDRIDLLLKGMHCLKCTLWVSETCHTTEVKTAQRGLRTG